MNGKTPWHENAVIYAIDVEKFYDSDGDGVGDFQGLVDRLDYLNRLGVSVIWLLPFYPTPNLDNGYDVTDYYGVDSRLGTLGDFVQFVDEADERGIKVLIDLVVNHTSIKHPWFREARSDPTSQYRDYYIWRDEPPTDGPVRENAFPGEVEDGRVWTYDEEAEAYYYHRFYPFQPDLNLENPDVREEISKIVTFWLQLGVAGFRIDAATLMIQRKDPDLPVQDDLHEILQGLKRTVVRNRGDAILLAEADDDPATLGNYFGEGDQMDLLLNFVLNAHLMHALATERADPVVEGLHRLPKPTEYGQWANFLRNYDELNLGRLSSEDREEVFERFAPEERMRIYGRGIRRRLAPILGGDESHIKLAFSLLFSMPGVPLLMYGDEIGMGDDLSLPGRIAVRTPMQWSDDRNAGFSTALPEELVRPVIDEGPYAFDRTNVADQEGDPDSLLQWVTRLIATRHECPEIGVNDYELVETTSENVLVMLYPGDDGGVLTVHNLADEMQVDEFDDGFVNGRSINRLMGEAILEQNDGITVTLDGYDFGWYRIGKPGSVSRSFE